MLMPKSLIEYESNEHRNKTENQTTPPKTTKNSPLQSNDEITRKKCRSM